MSRRIRLYLLALAVTVVVVILWWRSSSGGDRGLKPGENPALRAVRERFEAIEGQEQRADQTCWAKETLARECGRTVEDLWDKLNRSTNQLQALARFPVAAVLTDLAPRPLEWAHGIRSREPGGQPNRWTGSEWRGFLAGLDADGWRLEQTEFRHVQFELSAQGKPWRSRYRFTAHLLNAKRNARAALEGDLRVEWTQGPSESTRWAIGEVDATRVFLRSRTGDPIFREVLNQRVDPPRGSFFIDPLILSDLDGDGRSEIILAASNLAFHHVADQFEARPLCALDPGLIFTAVIADFTGDGVRDLLTAKFEGLFLYEGSAKDAAFMSAPRQVWLASPRLRYVQVLAAGDVDGDGDLDLWLGQYRTPYERGQMPTPFYDANDGHPAWLLKNDGHGQFTDATAGSGLEKRRHRRSYGASFVDLDHDGDQDLVLVNDFAGLDYFRNEGGGRFVEATEELFADPKATGMSHVVADFDADGRLDVLLVGMNVPTVDRVIGLGLERPGFPGYGAMKPRMAYGNRLFLAQANGRFAQTALSDSIAKSGWSWGACPIDFDNDRFPDVYIATGHESRESVQDYEPEFWLHDIYVGSSKDDPAVDAYFRTKISRTRGRGQSYGGYEKNRLYWNQGGKAFVDIAWLAGVAMPEDSRSVVAEDLDGDGRQDLVVTTFEAWPEVRQTVRVFRNQLPDAGNWVGLRFNDATDAAAWIGAEVRIQHEKGVSRRPLLLGESFRSQLPPDAHFGLGDVTSIERMEVVWPGGKTQSLSRPAVNQGHRLQRQ